MKRSRSFPIVTTLAGIVLGAATLGFALASDSPVVGQAASTLPVRAIEPLVAADDAPGAPAATATATRTAAATATPTGTPLTGLACGEERWAVKTLTDGDYSQVNFTAVDSSVHSLRLRRR